MTKRKFSKLLGKEAEYTAVKTKPKYEGEKSEFGAVLLTDIRYKGKLYADHSWINIGDALDRFEFGDKIGFTATASMYTDGHGVRKQGIHKCHKFHATHDTYDKDEAKKNILQTFKRRKNRKYS